MRAEGKGEPWPGLPQAAPCAPAAAACWQLGRRPPGRSGLQRCGPAATRLGQPAGLKARLGRPSRAHLAAGCRTPARRPYRVRIACRRSRSATCKPLQAPDDKPHDGAAARCHPQCRLQQPRAGAPQAGCERREEGAAGVRGWRRRPPPLPPGRCRRPCGPQLVSPAAALPCLQRQAPAGCHGVHC